MRVNTVEIAWHVGEDGKNQPILAADFHPTLDVFATSGGDKEIKLWRLNLDPKKNQADDTEKENKTPPQSFASVSAFGEAKGMGVVDCNGPVKYLSSLTGHQKGVNCVRFSPNGRWIASAGDDGLVIIWGKNTTWGGPDWSWATVSSEKDYSRSFFRGHLEDVYDVSWSPDSKYLVSGSIDNTAIVWEVSTGQRLCAIKNHSHYIQGAAWHPFEGVVALQSSDRTCSVHSLDVSQKTVKGRLCAVGTTKPIAEISHRTSQEEASPEEASQASFGEMDKESALSTDGDKLSRDPKRQCRLFVSEMVSSFFRRLCWTPDGLFLLTPAGQFQGPGDFQVTNTTFMFSIGALENPLLHTPGFSKAAICVRCCPVLFEIRQPADTAAAPKVLLDLPYRMVYAVATLDSVLVYDTQHYNPICLFKNLHLAELTDVAWSADGSALLISSLDGYCSVVHFTQGELGNPLKLEDHPVYMRKTIVEEPEEAPIMEKKEPKKLEPAAPSSILDFCSPNGKTASGKSSAGQMFFKPRPAATKAVQKTPTKPSADPPENSLQDAKKSRKRVAPTLISSPQQILNFVKAKPSAEKSVTSSTQGYPVNGGVTKKRITTTPNAVQTGIFGASLGSKSKNGTPKTKRRIVPTLVADP